MKWTLALALACAALSASGAADIVETIVVTELKPGDATDLMNELVREQQWKKKAIGFSYEGPRTNVPGYFAFDMYRSNPKGMDAVQGSVAVDARTGDVFDVTSCKRYRSPGLTKLQHAIWKHTALTEHLYRKLRRPYAAC